MNGFKSYVLSFGGGAYLSSASVLSNRLHRDKRTVFIADAFQTRNPQLISEIQKQLLFLLDDKQPVEILALTTERLE